MNSTKSGNSTIVLALILVGLLALAAFMLNEKQSELVVAPPTPMIESTADLDKINKDLDSVDVNEVDTELKEVSKDAAAI